MYVDIFNTDRKYSIIYADPPWKYDSRIMSASHKGNAEDHYSTMQLDDICSLPIKQISDENCVLFMWATYPKFREALEVITAWGFTYKTIGFQWVKLNRSGKGYFFGLGRWTRGNTEPCLIAVKGKPKRINASVSQLIFSPVGKHSAKPPIVRKKIVKLMGGGSRIELFARTAAKGWDCWGNQAPQEGTAAEIPDTLECEEIAGQETFFEIMKGDKRA